MNVLSADRPKLPINGPIHLCIYLSMYISAYLLSNYPSIVIYLSIYSSIPVALCPRCIFFAYTCNHRFFHTFLPCSVYFAGIYLSIYLYVCIFICLSSCVCLRQVCVSFLAACKAKLLWETSFHFRLQSKQTSDGDSFANRMLTAQLDQLVSPLQYSVAILFSDFGLHLAQKSGRSSVLATFVRKSRNPCSCHPKGSLHFRHREPGSLLSEFQMCFALQMCGSLIFRQSFTKGLWALWLGHTRPSWRQTKHTAFGAVATFQPRACRSLSHWHVLFPDISVCWRHFRYTWEVWLLSLLRWWESTCRRLWRINGILQEFHQDLIAVLRKHLDPPACFNGLDRDTDTFFLFEHVWSVGTSKFSMCLRLFGSEAASECQERVGSECKMGQIMTNRKLEKQQKFVSSGRRFPYFQRNCIPETPTQLVAGKWISTGWSHRVLFWVSKQKVSISLSFEKEFLLISLSSFRLFDSSLLQCFRMGAIEKVHETRPGGLRTIRRLRTPDFELTNSSNSIFIHIFIYLPISIHIYPINLS